MKLEFYNAVNCDLSYVVVKDVDWHCYLFFSCFPEIMWEVVRWTVDTKNSTLVSI